MIGVDAVAEVVGLFTGLEDILGDMRRVRSQ